MYLLSSGTRCGCGHWIDSYSVRPYDAEYTAILELGLHCSCTISFSQATLERNSSGREAGNGLELTLLFATRKIERVPDASAKRDEGRSAPKRTSAKVCPSIRKGRHHPNENVDMAGRCDRCSPQATGTALEKQVCTRHAPTGAYSLASTHPQPRTQMSTHPQLVPNVP